MAKIDLDHDGMKVGLGPGISKGWLLFWVVLAVLSCCGVVVGLARSAILIRFALVVLAGSVGSCISLARKRQRSIVCDGRTVIFDYGQPLSLLDIKSVAAKDGQLWMETELGPLQPFERGPYRETDEELAKVAALLNTAIAQAQAKRGDAPDKQFYKMKQVMKQDE